MLAEMADGGGPSCYIMKAAARVIKACHRTLKHVGEKQWPMLKSKRHRDVTAMRPQLSRRGECPHAAASSRRVIVRRRACSALGGSNE